MVKELNPILKDKDLEYGHNDIRYTISILENEITEDEKLLAVEEEQIIKAHEAGQAFAVGSHKDFKQIHPDAPDYYNQRFKND